MPNTQQRRLSARRGSTTAPDPYGTHASINDAPHRTSQSKLTIVRVLGAHSPAPSPPLTLNEPPSSFTSRRRRPGSIGSISSIGSSGSPSNVDSPPSGRLSFAFSSFGSPDNTQAAGDHHRSSSFHAPASPNSSPRLRPSSPRLSASGGHGGYVGSSGSFSSKPRLTPDQLVDLARQATNPRTLAQFASHGVSPGATSSSPGSPILRAQTPGTPSSVTSGGAGATVAPATFTPLPDDIYLPFIDRPGEVAALISTVPDAKLFALLSQTLPKTYDGPLYVPDSPSAAKEAADGGSSVDSSSSKHVSNQLPEFITQFPPDPAHWTHAHLITHLTQIDRDIAPDPIWVAAARRCIRTHSELIWERVKGGLGVPPELDGDYPFERVAYQKALELAATSGEYAPYAEGMGGMGKRKGSTTGKKERTDSARMGERMRRLRAELRQGAPKQRLGLKGHEDESALDVEDDEHEHEVGIPPSLAKRWAGLQQQGQGGSGMSTPTPEDPHSARSGGGFANRSKVDTSTTKGTAKRDSVHEVGGLVVGEFTEETLGVSKASEGGVDVPAAGTVAGDDASELVDTEDDGDVEDEDGDEVEIEIEPILAPSPNSPFDSLTLGGGANPPPPLSHATKELVDAGVASDVPAADGVGLGDIAEGEEEDDDNDNEDQNKDGKEKVKKEEVGEEAGEGEEEEEVIPASQIAGLRIKTAPVHAAGSYGVGGVYVPHHPSPSLTDYSAISSPMPLDDSLNEPRSLASGHIISPPVGVGLGRSQSHSRTSSFSSLSGVSIGPFSRKESCGSAANLKELTRHYGSSEQGDGYGSDWSVGANAGSVKGGSAKGGHKGEGGNGESVGDRRPGEPLFVSNFARLNGGPTLVGRSRSRGAGVKRSGSVNSAKSVGVESPLPSEAGVVGVKSV